MSHTGDKLTCIIIRTLVAKDGLCHVQAGGGIVADSQPEKEYEESVNKAMAALRAAEGAAKKS
ncbi:MAG: chorismate-binding protein [Proteobacteria bacterium]|nr:chorismate-binding protein [Pseudomonadota bacterium]